MIPSEANPFRHLHDALGPTEEQKARMLRVVREKMVSARNIRSVRDALTPDDGAQIRIWNRIRERISPLRARGFLEQVRTFLTPEQSASAHVVRVFLPRLQPIAVPSRPLKWVAAFALVLLATRAAPVLFLAPQTIAQSNVLLRPTKGAVAVSLNGLLQPVASEIELLEPVSIRSEDGEATVLLHDDGTVRLAGETSITLQDLTDRPAKGSGLATLILNSGTVWLQGLVPDHLRGLSVVTPGGIVTVHGGSVSVTVDGTNVTVEVWDRHARLEREGQADLVLVAGERLVAAGDALTVERMPESAFDDTWPAQNLSRDAIHQRAIAQEQRERIAARAGILPTSSLYGVKRLAEEVDVLFTFNHEESVKKRLAQATTRLNEATTLITEGRSGATLQLEEYRTAVLEIANGSGDLVTQRLVEQSVAENAAQLGAQLSDEDVYVVKHLVLSTSAELPSPPIDAADVEASVIGDAVGALQIAVTEGDAAGVQEGLETLAPYIEGLPNDTDIDPTVKKEMLSRLARVADTLQNDAAVAGGSGAVAMRTVSRVIRSYVPVVPPTPHLTDGEVAVMIDVLLDRVFTYSQYTGQTNELRQQMLKLAGHPDEGMILRALYEELHAYEALNSDRDGVFAPDFRLSTLVRAAIQDLRERQEQVD